MKRHKIKTALMILGGLFIFIFSISIIWISTLKIPDFKSFTERKIANSSKIYDRTGTVLLYDVHQNIKRTVISYEDIDIDVKNATVAIEDSEFYNHKGIRIKSIIRALYATLTGKRVEGGSTITQQLIKNTLLTQKRSIPRKIKEWILSIKLERVMNKDEILALYLNEAPYGGQIYGIKEASKLFFGKEPKELTLAESAYLAAIPNSPTYYSPYRKHKDKLDERKNLVLKRMYDLKFIDEKTYINAKNEVVVFQKEQPVHIAAPHFVFFIKDYLEKNYGTDALDYGGLKVITTLDYDLQKKSEDLIKLKALENEKNSNGKNAAVVAIDPNTGQILTMVGSRDYFDKTIDGNFNVVTAQRQPGSSFKPFVYALAFNKGYTEDTVLFDVKTEFSSSCNEHGRPLTKSKTIKCYSPDNYDNSFRGPMTLKNALAQSINVIAVKLLYLVGVKDSINLAKEMGITSLNDPDRYGLSLVIGGGEVSLLDLTSSYGVFATEGVRHPYTGILRVEDKDGSVKEEFRDTSYNILPENTTRIISDILSDNTARIPTFGANSSLVTPGIETAVKTGTTNNNKDAWTIGYTTSVVVGAWVGNNDNTPMKKGGAALAGPIWNAVITEATKTRPWQAFEKPDPIPQSAEPILKGQWQGYPNTILYYINKDKNYLEFTSGNTSDSLFNNWEYGVRKWFKDNNIPFVDTLPESQTVTDNSFVKINNIGLLDANTQTTITIDKSPDINKIDIFINNKYVAVLKNINSYTFTPKNIDSISNDNIIKVIGYKENGMSTEDSYTFSVSGL